MTYSYTTLEQMRVEAVSQAGTEPTDATKLATYYANLTQYGITASGVIDRLKNTTFAPLVASRVTDRTNDRVISSSKMFLGQPLLELTSVTLPDDTTPTVGTDIRAELVSVSPKRWLKMMTTSYSFNTTSGTLVDDITVTGVWGWHSDYDNAWISSGDTVKDAAGISASETTITVTDVDGAGGLGFTPRFSAGNLIKIESEYCSIVSTNTTTQTMVVVRGVRGSTAASHALGTAISVFVPDDAIIRATTKLAVFMYTARGSAAQVSFETIRTNPNNVTALSEVLTLLDNYQFIQFAGV